MTEQEFVDMTIKVLAKVIRVLQHQKEPKPVGYEAFIRVKNDHDDGYHHLSLGRFRDYEAAVIALARMLDDVMGRGYWTFDGQFAPAKWTGHTVGYVEHIYDAKLVNTKEQG